MLTASLRMQTSQSSSSGGVGASVGAKGKGKKGITGSGAGEEGGVSHERLVGSGSTVFWGFGECLLT